MLMYNHLPPQSPAGVAHLPFDIHIAGMPNKLQDECLCLGKLMHDLLEEEEVLRTNHVIFELEKVDDHLINGRQGELEPTNGIQNGQDRRVYGGNDSSHEGRSRSVCLSSRRDERRPCLG